MSESAHCSPDLSCLWERIQSTEGTDETLYLLGVAPVSFIQGPASLRLRPAWPVTNPEIAPLHNLSTIGRTVAATGKKKAAAPRGTTAFHHKPRTRSVSATMVVLRGPWNQTTESVSTRHHHIILLIWLALRSCIQSLLGSGTTSIGFALPRAVL